jgi:hypothetical protein
MVSLLPSHSLLTGGPRLGERQDPELLEQRGSICRTLHVRVLNAVQFLNIPPKNRQFNAGIR